MSSPRGRPRIQETADEIVASVLATAGPRVGTAEFSTRRVAELTGLSQSVVSRAFRRIRAGEMGAGVDDPGVATGDPESAGGETGSGLLRLMSFHVSFPQIRLSFTPVERAGPVQRGQTTFQRRAAALMAALWVSGASLWPVSEEQVAEQAGHEAGQSRRAASSQELLWSPGDGIWTGFLAQVASLLDRCAAEVDAIPGELLRQLASRAGRGLHGVEWTRDAGVTDHVSSDSDALSVPEYPAPGRASRWLPHTQLSVTEQIAIALRKEIMHAGYRPGDRITPGPLASRLGVGATTVRAAMRRLADDGLLDSTPSGFSVPQVTGADVVDLYAARLHVGMVLLHGCAAQPRNRLLPARLALSTVEAAARRGAASDVDHADLQFQQELADAAGLEQSARSFHALTLRVRMFISVLQLDYSPAMERILHDDRRLMAALLAGQPEPAVRIWRGKLDNAVRHMSALAPEAFDADLWARLSRG